MSQTKSKNSESTPRVTLVLNCTNPQREDWVKERLPAAKVLSSSNKTVDSDEIRVVATDQRIELWDDQTPHGRGTFVDFSNIDTRTGTGNLGKNQPLRKAIGERARSVIDATAGFGQDTVLLACMGFEVTAFERNPVVATLLADGLVRAKQTKALIEPISRVQLVVADTKQSLPQFTPSPDVIYIDGMFPLKRSKSALSKKPMRLARRLVGEDSDLPELLKVARRHAALRVVVKRPRGVTPLGDGVSARIKTKLVTYDIYPTAPN